MKSKFILWFSEILNRDVPRVGGKNASLGEMFNQLTRQGIRVPDGFAITAEAYWYFLKTTNLDKKIKGILKELNIKDVKNLSQRSNAIRQLILTAPLPTDLQEMIVNFYRKLSKKYKVKEVDVAVRSSATAEDLPSASFAGVHESFLNIHGEKQILEAVRKCIASLFTNRAIVYREENGFDHLKVALSVGVQKMIRSDLTCSGVIFTCDTETGFVDVTVINSSWGLGENIVQGKVNPDEFIVYKPLLKRGFKPIISKKLGSKEWKLVYSIKRQKSTINLRVPKAEQEKFTLSEDEILELGRYSIIIENHYHRPMDIEWAKDGGDKKLYILQARPETVQSKKTIDVLEEHVLMTKGKGLRILTSGAAIGSKITYGGANIIKSANEIQKFKPGQVLVTEMTDPDWVPIMKIASAIVTNAGGRTCFTGETMILTDKGFLSIREIVEKYDTEDYKILSLNKKTLRLEWKRVINGMVRENPPIQINISQTGRMKDNVLNITPDHKFLTFENRQLISREIQQILNNKQLILNLVRIPAEGRLKLNSQLGYLLGGVSTDGHIYLTKEHGEVQFVQKPIPQKLPFIEKMKRCLTRVFNYSFHTSNKKLSNGLIRGKSIKGSATAYRCYSKKIALELLAEQKKLSISLLGAPEKFIYNFLAGVIDGDGTYSEKANRINIFCSKDNLLQAIIIACLRLNINFQVSRNRSIYNIQIVDKIEEIFNYTSRVKGNFRRKKFGTRFFAAKQLLEDIRGMVNYRGRIIPYIDNNLLIDIEKVKNYIIPLIAGRPPNHELTKIINSDLKMLRVNFGKSLETQKVYNITVEDNHNYVVFTKRYTPVVVNNCHAAIVSRELGIPCIVGTTNATKVLKQNQKVTVSCAEGEKGYVYDGLIPFKIKKTSIKRLKKPKVKIMMNVGEPDQALAFSFIPNDGVGLAREEFIINDYIGVHPLALIDYKKIKNISIKKKINRVTSGYKDKIQFYVDKLAEGIGRIAAAFYPKDVIVRFSDFKTNEYANLIGGQLFEPKESNPMIGWRGASRYYDPKFKKAFGLECLAIKKVREVFGLDNVIVMVPFCRTPEEGREVIKIMGEFGLSRNPIKNLKPLQVYVMAEIPSNVILAEEFAKIFDGFSIGSNDLTQLILGVDRDSGLVAHVYNERNEAIKKSISQLMKIAHQYKRKVGICGQAPSDFPEFAEFLIRLGIDSISLNPDSVIKTMVNLAKKDTNY